ncbi:MAG: PqqD family protein [Pseudolabrys sp.]
MRARSEAEAESVDRARRFRFYGEQFLLDTVSGKFYRLTPTAGFILRALIDRKSNDQLIEMVERRYGVDRGRAGRDVELFLAELRSLGIIENSSH